MKLTRVAVGQNGSGVAALVVVDVLRGFLERDAKGVGEAGQRAAVAVTVPGDDAVGVGQGRDPPQRVVAVISPETEAVAVAGAVQDV